MFTLTRKWNGEIVDTLDVYESANEVMKANPLGSVYIKGLDQAGELVGRDAMNINGIPGYYSEPLRVELTDDVWQLPIGFSPDRRQELTSAAAALGRKGGQATTEAKQAAARENGKKGGRPRKS